MDKYFIYHFEPALLILLTCSKTMIKHSIWISQYTESTKVILFLLTVFFICSCWIPYRIPLICVFWDSTTLPPKHIFFSLKWRTNQAYLHSNIFLVIRLLSALLYVGPLKLSYGVDISEITYFYRLLLEGAAYFLDMEAKQRNYLLII